MPRNSGTRQRRWGEAFIVGGLAEWGIELLDSLGRWETLMGLPHPTVLNVIFGPLVTPGLIFLGMLLFVRSRESEYRGLLEEANKPPAIIGADRHHSAPRPFWKPLIWAPLIAIIIAALFVGANLWFYAPEPPQVAVLPPSVDPLAYRVYPPASENQAAKPPIHISQQTNSPCSGNAIGGGVNNENCGTTDPYRPVATYDPNGMKRIISPGRIDGDSSLIDVYKKFDLLISNREWSGILALADKTRATDPGWFTLDYVSGVAEFYSCQKNEATTYLKKLTSESGESPPYANFRNRAQLMLAQLNAIDYLSSCLATRRQ